MKKEILIYGLAKNETRDYMEQLLACFDDNSLTITNIERVKAAALEHGFHSFRVATYNGEKPNFSQAVNI
jgi:hypothetical protein